MHRPKPSPGGEGVTPFGVTDEVEGSSVVPTYCDSRWLRPHQSQLTLRQLPLQGKPSLRSTGAVAQREALSCWRGWHGASRDGCGGDHLRFIGLPGNMLRPTSVLAYAKPPSPQGEGFGRCKPSAPTAPHPVPSGPPSPRGRRISEVRGRFLRVKAPLCRGSHTPRRFCVWNPSGRGMPPPLHAKNDPASRPYARSSLFPFLFSLIKIMPLPELSSGERSCLYFVPKMRSPASPRPGMM